MLCNPIFLLQFKVQEISKSYFFEMSFFYNVDPQVQHISRGANVQRLERKGNRCVMCQPKLGRRRHDLFGLVDVLRVVSDDPLLELPTILAMGFHQMLQPFRILSVDDDASVFVGVTAKMGLPQLLAWYC